jgi:hypothetical protein
MSEALADHVLGQKKMLTPEGESGRSQKRSQSHKLFTKDDPGLKQIFSDCSQ